MEQFHFTRFNRRLEPVYMKAVMSSWGGRRTLPYVFTEQGVAMLSSVLRSKKA
ncbi:MAG: ORF6N domain-containing protein, partial [bacterium]|nr:ORF6N domain-containing protein [bacterium]